MSKYLSEEQYAKVKAADMALKDLLCDGGFAYDCMQLGYKRIENPVVEFHRKARMGTFQPGGPEAMTDEEFNAKLAELETISKEAFDESRCLETDYADAYLRLMKALPDTLTALRALARLDQAEEEMRRIQDPEFYDEDELMFTEEELEAMGFFDEEEVMWCVDPPFETNDDPEEEEPSL